MSAREELLAQARRHMWAAWQLSSEELASQAADTLFGLGMLVPEGGAQELERTHNDLDGARLSLWEEEQDNARLRLALKSAQRGRLQARELVRQMVEALNCYDCPPPDESPLECADRWRRYADAAEARVAELEAERHVTNEALDDAVRALREKEQREAEPPLRGRALLDAVTVERAEETHWRRLGVEDPHDSPLHHTYRVPRDLPPLDGAPC